MIVVICAVVLLAVIIFSKMYSFNQVTHNIFEKSNVVLVNPYIGFAPPADGGSYAQPHSLVYANLTWRDLEPEKGFYDFETLAQKYKLNDWIDQDIKLVFRVVLDYPSDEKHKDIPDWLYDEVNQDGTWYSHEWGNGFSPNYENQKLIDYHEKLIAALGDRFNHDSNIAFIELGSLGHWGEWHTLQQDDIHIPFPELPVAEKYVGHYLHSFSNKPLLMRRPHQIAAAHKIGLYNDMFGNTQQTEEFEHWVNDGYQFWLTNEWHPSMSDTWKYAPIGGEFAPTHAWKDYFSLSNFEETKRQLNRTHVSFLGPSSPAHAQSNGTVQHHINDFLNKIGYRFHLEEAILPESVNQGSDFNLEMHWENNGVAPFYFAWPVECSMTDDEDEIIFKQILDADIRDWLPGEHHIKEEIKLQNDIAPGEYTVNIGILDPDTMEPGIRLATKTKNTSGRYVISRIVIK